MPGIDRPGHIDRTCATGHVPRMKKVLAMLLVATRAFAEEPAPPAPQPPAPAPAPAAPGDTEPAAPEQSPPGDPAYSQPPERDLADGGASYFAAPKGKDIVIKHYPDRSRKNVIGLWTTVGAGAVLGGVGFAFHLDYRSKSGDVAASRFTGQPWNAERQATYEDAQRSSTMAGVFYGLGGATLLAAVVAFIVTEPKVETMVIHPHVDPKSGGATLGAGWRF